MAQYRKKPIIIEAFKWTGDADQIEDPVWCINKIKDQTIFFGRDFSINKIVMLIKTLEGTMQANPGDYIIKGIKDEIYPCKPEIFEASYELVVELTK